MDRSHLAAVALAALLASTGCADKVDLVRAVSPADARASGLTPVAVIHEDERIPVPLGSRVEKDRVVVPSVQKLGPGDVVEQDALGRVTAIRQASGESIRFEPGTAVYVAGDDEVRGDREGMTGSIPLRYGDRIEVKGTFESDDALPGGGVVERKRSTGLIVGGATVLVLSYAPTAYVGAISHRRADGILFVPVAGPFLDLANRPACQQAAAAAVVPVDFCIEEKATRGALIAAGSVQSLGALLFLAGLPMRTNVIERTAAAPKRSAFSVHVVPTRDGVQANGTF
ncbi:MAG: hypothetical protein U0235_05495 [Polyangiaceae bacterium]